MDAWRAIGRAVLRRKCLDLRWGVLVSRAGRGQRSPLGFQQGRACESGLWLRLTQQCAGLLLAPTSTRDLDADTVRLVSRAVYPALLCLPPSAPFGWPLVKQGPFSLLFWFVLWDGPVRCVLSRGRIGVATRGFSPVPAAPPPSRARHPLAEPWAFCVMYLGLSLLPPTPTCM